MVFIMNNETYVECLVARKPSTIMKFLKTLCIMLCVAFFLIAILGLTNISIGIFIIAIGFGVLAYVCHMKSSIEYEYLYLDREITIDRISAQTKRKRVAKYEVDRMEILAPIKSYHLDNYKNRKTTDKDFSSGEEKQPDIRYAMYIEGDQKVIFEPSEAFVKAIATVAPRKVFKD